MRSYRHVRPGRKPFPTGGWDQGLSEWDAHWQHANVGERGGPLALAYVDIVWVLSATTHPLCPARHGSRDVDLLMYTSQPFPLHFLFKVLGLDERPDMISFASAWSSSLCLVLLFVSCISPAASTSAEPLSVPPSYFW
jgi:hypothetical protein